MLLMRVGLQEILLVGALFALLIGVPLLAYLKTARMKKKD